MGQQTEIWPTERSGMVPPFRLEHHQWNQADGEGAAERREGSHVDARLCTWTRRQASMLNVLEKLPGPHKSITKNPPAPSKSMYGVPNIGQASRPAPPFICGAALLLDQLGTRFYTAWTCPNAAVVCRIKVCLPTLGSASVKNGLTPELSSWEMAVPSDAGELGKPT